MVEEYLFLFLFLLLLTAISIIILLLNFLFISFNKYVEKTSPYECGFQPFDNTNVQFDIRYYLVAILFLIFDLELVYLLPWIINLSELNFYGFFSMFLFFIFLILGFYYEWLKGGLE